MRLPFHNATGRGACPQCGQPTAVNPWHPRVNHTAESLASKRCHGCEFANDTYAETKIIIGAREQDGEPVYQYQGPRRTFEIWLQTRQA